MIEDAVIKTLCYRDLFDYPLTEVELIQFLIDIPARPNDVRRALAQLVAERKIEEKDGFYFLRGREEITRTRIRRGEISERKYVKAHRLTRLLRRVPWVKAVFLTGAMAVGNADEDGDFDFLIITAESRVWLVRLLTYVLFSLLRVKRKLGVETAPDRACLNMFLSEAALSMPENEQNLFTAHEVFLARPLWAKEYLHQRFLGKNPWVKDYLPNVEVPDIKEDEKYKRQNANLPATIYRLLTNSFWTFIDFTVHQLQLYYMRKRKTREIVERDRILFHPIDLSRKVLSAYRVKLYSAHHADPRFELDADEKKA